MSDSSHSCIDLFNGLFNSITSSCRPDHTPKLIPLDAAYVLYDKNIAYSEFLAIITLIPLILAVMLITTLLVRRDIEIFVQCVGLGSSSLLNAIFKRILKHPRPLHSSKGGYGMPSDHAQFMFFLVTYYYLWMKYRSHLSVTKQRVFLFVAIVFNVLIGYSRIHLGVHTIGQVCVGTVCGISLGYLYHLLCRHYIWQLYSFIEQTQLAQYFLLKDSSVVGTDCLSFERENTLRVKQEKKQKIQNKQK